MIRSLNSGAGARRLAVWDNGPVTRALLLAAVLIFPTDILACSAGPLVVLPEDGDGDGDGGGEFGDEGDLAPLDVAADSDPAPCDVAEVCGLCDAGQSVCIEPITVICDAGPCQPAWDDACAFYGC